MAVAQTVTWLPLDRWAELIGIHPFHFNQLDGGTLTPDTVCGEVFYQYNWQHSDRVGREEIAQAIRRAELDIAAEVGYNLLPDWTVEERLNYPRPSVPELYGMGVNPRYQLKSVELPRGHIISGGVRTKAVIQAGAAVVRSDADGDGYSELVTVTVATTVTDENEIHVYYPAKSAADTYEIRPITVTISGGNAVITFKSWQIVAEDQFDHIDPQPLDATAAASYETTVDVYRVYNDPATQLQFMWENSVYPNYPFETCGTCAACEFGTQAGCFHLRDKRMGFIVPAPGTWDSDNSEFTQAYWTVCREPDQIRVWYYSGYVDQSKARPYVEMSYYWETAVAYYAASLLERPVCGCSNVNQFIEKWREDKTMTGKDHGYFVTPEIIANKLGTSMGAINAYYAIKRNGVRINK